MSSNISSFQIGTIFYQSGYGYPTHIATRGCTYIDINTGTFYINQDGLADWVPFLDGSTVITGGTTNGAYLPLSGGTVTGPTSFTSGLTATTISATTYQNLPISGFVSGTGTTGTYPVFISGATIGNSRLVDGANGGIYTFGSQWINLINGGSVLTLNRSQSSMNIQLGVPTSIPTTISSTQNQEGLHITSVGDFVLKAGNPLAIVYNVNRANRNTNFGASGDTDYATQKVQVTGGLRVTGPYVDSSNSSGSTNQYLMSTITGTSWTSIPSVSGLYLPLSGGTVFGNTIFTSGLTVNGNSTITGTTFLGRTTFTKAGFATGDVLLDNGANDTPGLLMYYANNNNYGIDSWNGSFDILSGQLFRVTNNLNESGGAVKVAVDTSGNMVVTGFIKPNAWRAGQVINDIILSNTEVTISTTTIATSTSDTDFLTYSYTPLSSTSYLVIHYHLANYDFSSGTGNDSYISRIKVDGGEITYSTQSTVNGNRSGVLFPLTGRYTNSNTTAKSIVVACRRNSADDSITITNSSTSMWLRITEIAR